jgi:ATP-dependent helicase/nuclease subunit B
VITVEVRWTTYGAAARVALCRVVSEAKREDPLAPVTLLVPTNLAGVMARRALAQVNDDPRRGVAGLTVLTLDRLAEMVASPALTGAGRRPATRPVLAAAWRRALAEKPLRFEPVAAHPATVAALVEAHRRLRELTGTALDAVAAAGPLQRDLVDLHRRVARALDEGWYDVRLLRDTARERLAAGATTLDRLGTLVLHLPQDLDPSAAHLAAALAAHHRVTVVAAATGSARADRGVRDAVRALGADPGGPIVELSTAGRVLHASDSDDEVRCVVREVLAALRRLPAHRVAVLYAAADPYARLLAEHLATAGITTNGPGVRPTVERVLPRAFLELLALPEERYGRAQLMRVLCGAPVRDGNGKLLPTSRWDRLSRDAGVVAGPDWAERLRRYAAEQRARAEVEAASPEPREWVAEDGRRRADAADELRGFVADLRERLDAVVRARGWTALATWALDTYTALFGDERQRRRLPENEARAGDRVEAVLRGLVGLGGVEGGADLDLLRQVLEVELSEDVPRLGNYGTGVLVAPLSAAVGLDADEVFVLGLAEGIYPTRQREDALLPDDTRERTGGELPAVRERLDRQHRHLLAAFAAAPTVVASFPRGDLRGGGERLPSRWLLPTLRALTGRARLAATEWATADSGTVTGSPSYAASLASTPGPAHEQEWRLRAVSAGLARGRRVLDVLAEDTAVRAGIELVRARRGEEFTRYDGNLSAYAGALPDPADPARMVSPTQLEAWTGCPHGYFLARILRVEPVEQPEELLTMSPADRGDLLHSALDRFFRWLSEHDRVPGPGQAWTAEHRMRLRHIGEQVAKSAQERGVTGHPTMWARERLLVLDDLDRLLTEDERVRASEGRRQVRSELTFGRRGKSDPPEHTVPPPVEVPLRGGRMVRFAGSADRVDVRGDGTIVVVDYKSGKADKFKGLDENDPDKHGSKLQLPVYAYAARAALGQSFAPVRAEYWFIGPRDRGLRVGYELTPEVEQRYRDVVATVVDGIAGGIFPANVPEDRPWNPYVACPYCDPDGLGAKDRRIQWERKKSAPRVAAYVALIDPEQAS